MIFGYWHVQYLFYLTDLRYIAMYRHGFVIEYNKMYHQFPGGNSEWVPPDTIPNSAVKTLSADDSVYTHVKVGHRQDFNDKNPQW